MEKDIDRKVDCMVEEKITGLIRQRDMSLNNIKYCKNQIKIMEDSIISSKNSIEKLYKDIEKHKDHINLLAEKIKSMQINKDEEKKLIKEGLHSKLEKIEKLEKDIERFDKERKLYDDRIVDAKNIINEMKEDIYRCINCGYATDC